MNWKYEAIDRLKTYELKKNAVQSIPRQIEALELEMTVIRSTFSDSEQVDSSGGRSEDAMLSNIVKREELGRALELAQKSVKLTEAGLRMLDQEEQEVLDRFYIHPVHGAVMDLCDILGLEQASIYRRRNEALRKFTLAIYGCVES